VSELSKIAALLDSASPETQIAAAIVLGELETRDPAVVKGLIALAGSDVEGLAVAALRSLERIGSVKALPVLLDRLGGGAAVSGAAAKAIAALGEEALPELRARMKGADPALQAHLSEVLARIAGKKGIGALLDGFLSQDRDSALRSAVMVRQEVRGTDARSKKALLGQLEKFLEQKKTRANDVATQAALKIVGYLEDPAAVDALLPYTAARKNPSAVRVEALIALRFALGQNREAPKVVRALLELVDPKAEKDRMVLRTALDTLGNLALSRDAVKPFEKVALGEDPELAKTAISRLGAMGGPAAAALVTIATEGDRARGEQAMAALGDREEGRSALLDAFLDARKPAEAERLAWLLKPQARRLSPKLKDALEKAARARLRKGIEGAEAALALLREADVHRFAEALRDEAEKAYAGRDRATARTLYAYLARTADATDDDRLALARLTLLESALDLSPHARARDAGLALLVDLARKGAPVAEKLRKDRAMDPERLLYVGFHLAELPEGDGRESGHEILAALAEGRGKLAKQAKNKLKTTGYEE
jgi:hypothetical protein